MKNQHQQSKRLRSYGPWAVVTGASSGMGSAFARQLAAEGFNLIIAARRIHRLDQLASELVDAHGVQVLAIQADLADPAGVESVVKEAAGKDVGLVVSNAGSARPGSFLSVPLDGQMGTIDLNVTATVHMAHTLGAQLLARGQGGYILIGSTSAFGGVPFMATYAATKAFVGSLGEALRVEWKAKGVDVLVVHPGPTRTEMVETDGVDFDSVPMPWMSAEDVVSKSLRALGKRGELIPGVPNKIFRLVTTRLIPRKAGVRTAGALMSKVTNDELQ